MPWLLDLVQHAFAFERAVVTPYTFTTICLPAVLSYYTMAILVQLPHTSLYRAAFLPVVLWLFFRAAMSLDFSWNHLASRHFNQLLVVGMTENAMRSTIWAFAQRPYIRLPIGISGGVIIGDHQEDIPAATECCVSITSAMWNALDLAVNFRGIGWDGPQKIRAPKPYFRVESRLMFAVLSLCQSILLVLVFCILHRTIRSLGLDTFARPEGGTIFNPSLPPVERYIKSSIITLLSGTAAYALLDSFYKLHAALFTIIFQQHPSQWPPLFDSPWLSTSLASFWGRRWHQVLRECFAEIGSRPMERYFGRVGTIMGAFAVSGALHDIGSPEIGPGGDTLPVVGFFLLQGVGVTMEYIWKQATGRHVGGVFGWLWAFSWLILSGNLFVDVWARRGLIGSTPCLVPTCF